jgi:hypothetical protein
MAATQRTHDLDASTGAGLLFGAGAVALGVFSTARPLVGVAVYVAAAVTSVAVWSWTDSETSVSEDFGEASPADTTLGILGMASAVVFPALVAADGLGYFTWTALTAGGAVTVAGIFVVFGVVSLLSVGYQR